MADQDLKKHSTTTHDIVTGGIEGAVGSIAIDPAFRSLAGEEALNPFRKGIAKRLGIAAAVGAGATGLIGAIVSATSRKRAERKASRTEMSAIVEFAETLEDRIPRAKARNRPLVTAAGVTAIAAGASLFPAARRLIGIKARGVGAANLGIQEAARNSGGKLVADYIEAAQLGLNTGLRGKGMGKLIQHVIKNPEGSVAGVFKKVPGQYGSGDIGQRLASEHFARFRASPKSALDFWDYEHSLLHEGKHASRMANLKKNGLDTGNLMARRQKQLDEMHYGREKAHAAIKEQIETHGKSEMEAIKHVAYNSPDPQVNHYFNELAKSKTGAVDQYAKKALVSPALVAGGTAGIVYGRKRHESPADALKTSARRSVRLEAELNEVIVEFESDNSLRAGVRLDKYEKTIRAREIDRHLHDYLRASAIGAVAGAAIPAPRSLKERVLIGAGGGAAVEGVLHAAGHKDAYGEQSEDAKILQRNAPKFIGAATVVGGLVARYRRRLQAVKSVVGR
jgi:hypothetical protein